ncbi:DinB family protein [Dyadobacter sandarakinus]|uniref:DinB family protein n=1 Tax=Dyadobacter sandarakinus TaxID=2747268 RepID=A0ABX7I3X0_9BACT|nr:DinB family protein [Dyadobacter sandarakinus]QRR00767.1 DinB family protein [Dyadobacter sandarakinus]
MTEPELLIQQTINAYEWTNRLLDAVPVGKWDLIPDVVDTSINWQVGHLIVSHYFHSVMVIRGHQMDVLQKLPIKEYSELFTVANPSLSVGKVDPVRLYEALKVMQQKSVEVLSSLSVAELADPLEPTPVPHPIATTKFEAIDWNIKHTMYHCGQIGMISRVVEKRYDFGLRLSK